jgi:hypothetical protein
MSPSSLTDSEIISEVECPHFFPGTAGPIVKILLYTDEPLEITDDVVKDWSLGVMLLHIKAHAPAFASLCIKLVSRNSTNETHADNRLDDLLEEEGFDQIWFFGFHQGNRENFTMEVLRGGPHSELDEAEVRALEEWMTVGEEDGQRGGGVLMTGDHAEEPPPDAILPDSEQPPASEGEEKVVFWGLGRALGRHVPRAGQMRVWEGPPTRRTVDSQNTQVLLSGSNFGNPGLQHDPNPQRLILEKFNPQGQPAKDGLPHPLFIYKPGNFIQVYPDHMHEGGVVLPKEEDLADPNVWPNGQLVRPQVVARGTDSSKAQRVDLVAAYDGDRARVGRIVADSTWHHYFNVNLNRFIPPGEIDSPTDQIGQFYGNLAIWLTPLAKRREMARAMIRWVALHPLLLEERVWEDLDEDNEDLDEGNLVGVLLYLGSTAYHLISQMASSFEIHELLCALLPDDVSEKVETLYLPENGFALGTFGSNEFLLPSKELLLGSFTNMYHREMAHVESRGGTSEELRQARDKVSAGGFNYALKVQNSYINKLASASKSWFESKEEKE